MIFIAVAFGAEGGESRSEESKAEEWKVDAPHGAVHTVALDLDEVTWSSVTVHGERVVFDLLGDLWSIPLAGGVAKRLTSGASWDGQPSFSPDGTRIAFTSDRGGNENVWTMNADGTGAAAFTDDEDARCTEPFWDPAGPYLLYRRRTVDTRSIGVTEIWQRHLKGGDGFPLTDKEDDPHAAEVWATSRYVWFSSRHGRFEYDEDAVAGLWDVVRLDRSTGDQRVAVHGPGSASRPVVSPDGAWLYFVSRERTKTLLERIALASGRRETVADWLSPDELETFALHGTYPGIDWTDDGDLVVWAAGKLWRFDPETRERAEIPFRVHGEWTLHDTTRWPVPVPDTVKAKVIRWPTLSSRGSWAFSALGALWVRTPDGQTTRISEGTGYAPAWSPDGKTLAWTSWDDETGGQLHLTGPNGRTEELPVSGQLTDPSWSEDGRSLVVLRGAGGGLVDADLADEAWYEIVALEPGKGKSWTPRVVTAIDGQNGSRKSALRLHDGRIWFFEYRDAEPREPQIAVLRSVALDGTDARDHLNLGEAEEVVISPDFSRVAYKRAHQLHVAALPPFPRDLEIDGLPSHQVTSVVGDWLGFSPDGADVTWVEGPNLRRIPVEGLWDEDGDDEDDEDDAPKEDPRIVSLPLDLEVPRARPEGTVVLQGVRVITMNGDEVLDGVNVVIERDRIAEIGPGANRPGARVIDGTGKTVIPGLVDVHAHLHFSSADILPEQEWRYRVALDFGVTTVHDPSATTDLVFTQAERVEAGFEKGPRVLSTGSVLYGALSADAAVTETIDAARAHVRRLEAVGAHSVKVYQQGQRVRRQWYAQTCREEHVLCVPEGGGDLFMDLSMVVDGYHAIEHALPDAPLYADVLSLFAASSGGTGDGYGTFYTPTLQVAYGGLEAKMYFLQHENPVDDPRLRLHTPTRWLEASLWRGEVTGHDDDWRFRETARDAARFRDLGGHVTLGAHGELQGLGVHWELWALAGPGAMTPHEALRAATIEGARYLGLDTQIGTVEVGKLADLIVLDGDPLVDIRNSTKIRQVIKNGEIVVE